MTLTSINLIPPRAPRVTTRTRDVVSPAKGDEEPFLLRVNLAKPALGVSGKGRAPRYRISKMAGATRRALLWGLRMLDPGNNFRSVWSG